jgi:hypothetical protein
MSQWKVFIINILSQNPITCDIIVFNLEQKYTTMLFNHSILEIVIIWMHNTDNNVNKVWGCDVSLGKAMQ